MSAWTPTAREVHALIPTRNGGVPFDAESTPSASEVSTLIAGVVVEIGSEVGVVPEELHADAKWAATLGAAYHVEAGLAPEQQSDSLGPAGRLFTRYREQVERLKRRTSSALGTSTPFSGSLSTPLTTVVTTGGHPDAAAR